MKNYIFFNYRREPDRASSGFRSGWKWHTRTCNKIPYPFYCSESGCAKKATRRSGPCYRSESTHLYWWQARVSDSYNKYFGYLFDKQKVFWKLWTRIRLSEFSSSYWKSIDPRWVYFVWFLYRLKYVKATLLENFRYLYLDLRKKLWPAIWNCMLLFFYFHITEDE